ncbi:hypothetical protein jhhlp_000770 [Lomentospora prolificans]|uniref:ubiquitinyl hydrolase 1 n=1 Tax=Lomentospora prolificans TaxID=41688 RepID=A0A2N3NJN8_9PEZI|nr:hypothetical protein jhhlp_000770 [Lomentospora prolificans]
MYAIPLKVSAQNAGILVYRRKDSVLFEIFELAAPNKDVTQTLGRLKRQFPGIAYTIPTEKLDSEYIKTLSLTLKRMSGQQAPGTSASQTKGGQKHDEYREPVDPKIVTELLPAFMLPLGSVAEVMSISKNTRDEILWAQCLLPWRRSSTWLLIRVTIQLVLLRSGLDPVDAVSVYKHFMVFFASTILGKASTVLKADTDCVEWCDLVYAMKSKVSRRLHKLENAMTPSMQSQVRTIMSDAENLLKCHWQLVQTRGNTISRINNEILPTLNFKQDIVVNLRKLDAFIADISQRQSMARSARFLPQSPLAEGEEEPYVGFGQSDTKGVFRVHRLDKWITTTLPDMRTEINNDHRPIDYEGICRKLLNMMQTYNSIVEFEAGTNPESWSLMVLGVLELWVECDRAACRVCHLLEDYDPHIKIEHFQFLLLPFRSQMERLLKVEKYILDRKRRAVYSDILTSFGERHSFAVRYFDQSNEHKALRNKILESAEQGKQKKIREFHDRRAMYERLMRQFETSACEYYTQFKGEELVRTHKPSCSRCKALNCANRMMISIHEWPLPKLEDPAKTIVFELQVPSWFTIWRQATTFILFGIFKHEYAHKLNPGDRFPLNSDVHLSQKFRSFGYIRDARIGLLSKVKANVKSHYAQKLVSQLNKATSVLVDNAMQYQYYDHQNNCFTGSICAVGDTKQLVKSTTYQLPPTSMALQVFLHRPSTAPDGPAPNLVLATQHNCPAHMSLAEYKALCSMPLGRHIQWQNILLQATAPSVDFRKIESSLFVLQCIYQAGPPSKEGQWYRDGHSIPASMATFGQTMLCSLEDALVKVEDNWQCVHELATYIAIARRILTLSATDVMRHEALNFLTRARRIALRWVGVLKDRVDSAVHDEEKVVLRAKVAHAALVHADSFNVDDVLSDGRCVLRLILDSDTNAADFIETCITIEESYVDGQRTDDLQHILHWRWQRLCARAYVILYDLVVNESSNALDIAVSRSWAAYHPTEAGWRISPTALCRQGGKTWLMTESASCDGLGQLIVHYCLVTGDMRVNGLPLKRLPVAYEKTSMYGRLFGHTALEVMPGHMPGLPFSGKKRYMGHEIHLGLRAHDADGSDLLVRAIKDGTTWELVQPSFFQGFPTHFVKGYVHWYNTKLNVVEFRPMTDPWNSSEDNWNLVRFRAGGWRLGRRDHILIAPRALNSESKTAEAIGAILAPLVDWPDLHLIWRPSLAMLDIDIPNLKLGFMLKQSGEKITSRQFRGMAIDIDQSIGTLIGFINKLVLKSSSNLANRKVIIVEGPVTNSLSPTGAEVNVYKDRALRAHAYDIDERLGRLVDNGSLESKLYICYLHALSSFCLPDPLTKRTGTEQALDILDSAAVKSFPTFSQENINRLLDIAKLTPLRTYYPKHLKVMQTVSWSATLGCMAQHNGFFRAVRSLFDTAAERKFFYPERYLEPPSLEAYKPELITRDEIRSATFRVSNYGAEKFTTSRDLFYSPRDRGQATEAARWAYLMAHYIFNESEGLAAPMPINNVPQHVWQFLSQYAATDVLGPKSTLDFHGLKETLEYDARWLKSSHKTILAHGFVRYQGALSRNMRDIGKYNIMIWLATLAYAPDADKVIVQLLASFVKIAAISSIHAPNATKFEPSRGYSFNRKELGSKLRSESLQRRFQDCPESKGSGSRTKARWRWGNNRSEVIDSLLDTAEEKWPCECPHLGRHSKRGEWQVYLHSQEAIRVVHEHNQVWFDNYNLYQYLSEIAKNITTSRMRSSASIPVLSSSASNQLPWNEHRDGFVGETDVFNCLPPNLEDVKRHIPDPSLPLKTAPMDGVKAVVPTSLLGDLIEKLGSMASANFEKDYISALQQSAGSLELVTHNRPHGGHTEDMLQLLLVHLDRCKEYEELLYASLHGAIVNYMASRTHLEQSLLGTMAVSNTGSCLASHHPRVGPSFFLRFLSRNRWKSLSIGWKQCIVQYAVAVTHVQRAERMVSAAQSNDFVAVSSELNNCGHTNWDPLDHPDSLLLEVESGLMIRQVQEQIAAQMRSPPDSNNAVMQLNMGEGKSSVIVPIVAAALADGKRLVRVIVAKPQSQQMLQMLTSKLGGLLNRVIFQMPFSRALRVTEGEVGAIHGLLEKCREVGGVLLVQPEHILSFEQMGKEYAMDYAKRKAGEMLNHTRHFLFHNARDIVDESDENFSVKFELVYTMGEQQTVDHGSKRWKTIQDILDAVRAVSPGVKKELPDSVELFDSVKGSGGFPRMRILRDDAMQKLLAALVSHICDNGLTGFPLSRQTPAMREAVRTYITKIDLSEEEISCVEKEGSSGFWTDTVRPTLVLLRGLIACNILAFAFMQKRWRVNYGSAPARTPPTRLAVPYLAKDRPSARSEFSHPDVVIILTCLTYYYSGLTNDDLFLVFDRLLKSDQAEVEYALWVRDNPNMPPKLKSLAGVNVEDKRQCAESVFPHLKSSKAVIDYFLDRVVFEKEMREFPSKLSASGWDLGEKKRHPTTGFSGTNDSRRLLPLDVTQLDLPEQKHTNALVMSYLLQPETSVTDIPPKSSAQARDADVLLDLVVGLNPPVRVILDVGAQVLELSNLEVAQQWLQRVQDDQTQAAVFFDDNDELSVLNRSGYIERLQTSPFASQLDLCLVFLDEAHTRGTDLKLPTNYRAAVTLGANQTKDGLMQGKRLFPTLEPCPL